MTKPPAPTGRSTGLTRFVPPAPATAISPDPIPATNAAPKRSRPRPRRPADPALAWVRNLRRRRPGLIDFVVERLGGLYGVPAQTSRLDPVSELVLTILSQNTADLNSERAFEAMRAAYPSDGPVAAHRVVTPDGSEAPPEGWGGMGLAAGAPPDWAGVERDDVGALIEVIRIGGLANQKAPRIQAALRTIRERSGGYDLDFLAALPPLEARDWLTAIPGIGRKTASIVLLFCFGMPLMPVDTHVERVSRRIGLAPPAAGPDEQHEIYAHLLAPDQFYACHVLLIQHGRRTCDARRPACDRCPIAPRCRFFDPKAE